MMGYRTVCNTCIHGFEVVVTPEDSSLFESLVGATKTCKCPKLCGGSILLTNDYLLIDMYDKVDRKTRITASELYKAVHGVGLPDEIVKDAIVVESLLKANLIDAVKTEERNGRVYIHEIALDNGVSLHLAAGSAGAVVFKITKGTKKDGNGNTSGSSSPD